MKQKTIWISIIVSLLFLAACSSLQPTPEKKVPIEINVIFEDNNCLVTGNDQTTGTIIFFSLDNQSDSAVNITIVELDEGKTVDAVFNKFSPGSTDLPEGVVMNGKSVFYPSGAEIEDLRMSFLEGNYVILCETSPELEKYYGAGFSVP